MPVSTSFDVRLPHTISVYITVRSRTLPACTCGAVQQLLSPTSIAQGGPHPLEWWCPPPPLHLRPSCCPEMRFYQHGGEGSIVISRCRAPRLEVLLGDWGISPQGMGLINVKQARRVAESLQTLLTVLLGHFTIRSTTSICV